MKKTHPFLARLRALALVLPLLFAALLPMMLLSPPVAAQIKSVPDTVTDPVLEKRVLALSEQLRCLVCQNQTIADSHADLAIDLRNQVRDKMAQGWSDEKIVDYMVARYGDFVMYKPPFKTITVLLWVGPFALLLLAVLFFVSKVKRQRNEDEPSAVQLQQAQQLLGTDNKDQA